ncbi:YihY/virulence factor BrkB family protein [Mycolicibacterium iranicum]|uniref:Ribonuclease BN n=1 Tax=Mycolicibacterium iranicum TaxID=912594 RepID=A0A1X1WDG3_MYCIR|nr:YihY/virulence factor BrkB family protein [Mycolicibacterium iranicum]MCZ0727016.1 YihY/virulence factor BrkB family protein [Mycolicibacterium iranicum]ORV84627.1 ribonuclease BN [Mycolicibacterium iranicum]
MVKWLDRLQQRSRFAGFIIAVVYKYLDDQGGYLAALLTYYAFVSLFPLLLLLTTTLGVLLWNRPQWRAQIVDSAISQFPLIGDQLSRPESLSGGTTAVVVGILGALYGGLGVGQALQNAMNTLWSVPRFDRRDPIRSRVHSLLLLVILGSALVATTLLTGLGRNWASLGVVGTAGVVMASVLLNTAVCAVAFRVTTVRPLTWAQVMPGAVLAAVVWQGLQWFGASYVSHVVASASVTNSVFAIVLGLLAFLYLVSVALMLCAEINVVRVDRLHPRALLTPFTDNVDLTVADRKAYAGQAEAQRAKSFQQVDVSFGAAQPEGEVQMDNGEAALKPVQSLDNT